MLTYFKSLKQLDKVEGIWENNNYKIGIIKSKANPNIFNGIIISSKNENWMAGEVKLVAEKIKVIPINLNLLQATKQKQQKTALYF